VWNGDQPSQAEYDAALQTLGIAHARKEADDSFHSTDAAGMVAYGRGALGKGIAQPENLLQIGGIAKGVMGAYEATTAGKAFIQSMLAHSLEAGGTNAAIDTVSQGSRSAPGSRTIGAGSAPAWRLASAARLAARCTAPPPRSAGGDLDRPHRRRRRRSDRPRSGSRSSPSSQRQAAEATGREEVAFLVHAAGGQQVQAAARQRAAGDVEPRPGAGRRRNPGRDRLPRAAPGRNSGIKTRSRRERGRAGGWG
jgi:hypothetical protein